ncbi:nineteen complex-related protein 2-domain-containing protein [Chytridium lagenaria]|nr:nineteen complex-related protein 2-domain-containing protein [Chytridium lagenaria]
MFNSKKGRRKTGIVRLKSSGSSDDEKKEKWGDDANMQTDEPPKSKPQAKQPKSGKQAKLISFEEEEEAEEAEKAFKVKKSSASRKMARGDYNWESALEKMSGGTQKKDSGYSKEYLQELAQSQLKRPPSQFSGDMEGVADLEATPTHSTARIMDESEVAALKKLREAKRKGEQAGDYMAFDEETRKKPGTESRLVTEEQEMDVEEFEDYQGDKIEFGSKSEKYWKEKRMKEIKGSLDTMSIDDDTNDELESWEKAKVRAANTTRFAQNESSSMSLLNAPIPATSRIPQLESSFNRLEVMISMLELERTNTSNAANSHGNIIENSSTAIVEIENTIADASSRYEYFQELSTFLGNLGAFLDKKTPDVISLESDLLGKSLLRFSELSKVRESFFDFAYAAFTDYQNISISSEGMTSAFQNFIMNSSDSELLPLLLELSATMEEADKDDISDRKASVFADVAKQYRNLNLVKTNFIAFRDKYPADFKRSFAGLSFPAIANLFVRYDLLEWLPFKETRNLEQLSWHIILEDGELDDPDEPVPILMKAVQKSVFPRVRGAIGTLDLFSESQVQCAVVLLRNLEDYSSLQSRPFQQLVEGLAAHIDAVVVVATQRSGRQAVGLGEIGILALFFPRETVVAWVVDQILNRYLLPQLREPFQYENDIEKYEKIAEVIPIEWFGTCGKELSFLKATLNEFGKTFPL